MGVFANVMNNLRLIKSEPVIDRFRFNPILKTPQVNEKLERENQTCKAATCTLPKQKRVYAGTSGKH